ncbi:hypothetical protein SAMN02910275_00158 [Butyrivibrio sp. INlla18]|uniref:ABC-three component system middle component 7 n=1 Tax=Butyrivibrio sp. INlla18 TaxID=1520806 RepID=UPI000890F4B9|nr:ABC-three component system middle component 7 [Butyrivibrio sp. INlla18]SDA39038.1 hypothetical protein SAMN02910275_00158 [Butyrivibrio sp. INlla18]
MNLPGKSVMYSKSIFPLFPKILNILQEKSMTVNDLYQEMNIDCNFENFISALDSLYALGRIEIDEEEKKLYYVDGNQM